MRLSQLPLTHLEPEEKIRRFDEMPELIRQLRLSGQTVFLVPGVFDIVHIGHVGYIRRPLTLDAHSVVIVGVENDETVRINKGSNRPINPVADRIRVLAEFSSVTLIFPFEDVPAYNQPKNYLDRYRTLRADAITAPIWDPHLKLKHWQAAKVGSKLAVIDYKFDNSTTRMLRAVGYQEET